MFPSDLGLPSKFKSWRKGQLDTVLSVATSEKRFYMLSMPTGGGKSAVCVATAKVLGGRTLILTGTKGLQEQYMHDFASVGMVEIKGQSNYECLAEPGIQVNEGHCHGGGKCYLKAGGCTYYDAVRVAAKAPIVVTNFYYWMTINRFADPDSIGKFDLLILDEAHEVPEALSDFCTIRIDRAELRTLLDLDLPPLDEGQEAWADWATHARAVCAIRYSAAKLRVNEGTKYAQLVRKLTDLGRRLAELSRAGTWRRGEPSTPAVFVPGQATDWVAEPIKERRFPYKVRGAQFSPVWAHPYAEPYLFKNIPKVLLVSATLQRATAKYLGIGPDVYHYEESTSTFRPDRRPLMYLPTTKVDRNWSTGQQRVWVNKIDAIIGGRMDRKGIIHTRSYERAQLILASSRHNSIMLTHTSENTREVIEEFKRRPAPCVLVSPSVSTGWDFPYEQCEYQIIAKVPFLDTRSAVIKARTKSDKKYGNYMAALTIIQQYGRGMRAEDDSCETFVIDDHIEWFRAAAREFFPKWFMAAYRRMTGVPAPITKQRR